MTQSTVSVRELPFSELLYSVDGYVATITLNRPEKRNALTPTLINELIVALEGSDADPEIGAVILTGAGTSFCAGADLSAMSQGSHAQDSPIPQRGGFVELNLLLTRLGVPVIAKVRRYAIAGGLGLMCACQFAVSDDEAVFSTPEIDRGLFPMMIMANIFRTVPRRRGLEMILLGEKVSAQSAVAMGLINRAVPVEELDEAVKSFAEKLAMKPPAVMKLGLEAFYKQSEMSVEKALPYLEEMLMKCLATPDAQEGLMAFMQKRDPRWKGRC
jgi:enoyl-CoA hydratase/carnithine racemase